ncbi:MAG: hypothetical protein LBH79_10100, partial [Nitrososphaerota archaeon]|nr:hypothetical protein [Nitrososphaerota archaeon]
AACHGDDHFLLNESFYTLDKTQYQLKTLHHHSNINTLIFDCLTLLFLFSLLVVVGLSFLVAYHLYGVKMCKDLFCCMLLVGSIGGHLVRWDVAERLNRKQNK